jgi:DNA invertase Pin-like site-specific DNA recombinase
MSEITEAMRNYLAGAGKAMNEADNAHKQAIEIFEDALWFAADKGTSVRQISSCLNISPSTVWRGIKNSEHRKEAAWII